MAELVRLSPEDLAALLKAAGEKEPSLALQELTDSIADQLSLDRTRVREIVRVLSDFQFVREGFGLSVPDFISELRTAIEESGRDDLRPTNWTAFEAAITEALSGDNALAISSKARNILAEHPRVFCAGRILTDLRPVFGLNVERDPAAFLVVHTLKLMYHESEEHLEFYVALDNDDLKELARQIDRAIKKEASLRALTAKNGLRILEVNQ